MKKKSSKVKSISFWLSSFLVLYFISSVFVIPFILKNQAIDYLTNNLKNKTTLERVSFNPFGFEIKLYNFKLYDKKDSLLVNFETIRVDFNLIKSVFNQEINFDNITLYKPTVNVQLLKNGSINLLN